MIKLTHQYNYKYGHLMVFINIKNYHKNISIKINLLKLRFIDR